MMRLQPVKRRVEPVYPTRTTLDAQPELLRQVPRRWQANAAVLTTLAGLGLLAAPDLLSGAAGKFESPVVARVAPLFPQFRQEVIEVVTPLDRGGLAGDVIIPTPRLEEETRQKLLEVERQPRLVGELPETNAFMTEEAARQIIIEEAKKAGVSFQADVQVVKGVPFTTMKTDKDGRTSIETTKIELTFDGVDTKRHIGYEVVTNEDIAGWQKQGVKFSQDASPATVLRKGITQGVPVGTYVVFYDPAIQHGQSEDLRQQVRDFVAWLKTQGVI